MGTRQRDLPPFVSGVVLASMLALFITSLAYPQRTAPGAGANKNARPGRRGPKKDNPPAAPVKQTLSVVTTPAIANVVIKDEQGKVVGDGQSKEGKLEKELRPGVYRIEVTAEKYLPGTFEAVVRKGKTEVVQAKLAPSSGSILISLGSVGPDVTILIDGQKPANLMRKGNRIQIEDIRIGSHALRITHPSIASYEERVEVTGGTSTPVTPMFQSAVAELEVLSEPGAKVYIDSEQVGETNPEGRLKRSGVSVGRHEIQLTKDGYEDYKDSRPFDFGKTVLIDRRMTPKATSTGFSEDFGVAFGKWAVPPSGWTRKSGRLEIANSPQLGFASGYNYRDLIMQFHLKLANTGGAAWAVRVKDSRNYYLFYLSGPGGMFPKRFNTYVVRDNKLDLQNPINSDAVLHDLRPGSQYTIDISVSGNKIEHKITPTATGVSETLGSFEDPNNVFTIGSIGFRTVASEVFSIDDIIVQPIKR